MIIVGGLPGSGKATLLWNIVLRLTEKGKAVGLIIVAAGLLLGTAALAQDGGAGLRLEEVVVVAAKDPAPAQEVPASVTAIGGAALEDAGVRLVGDAAGYAPNVNMVEFTARSLSQPYFRGIGSSPNNPAVTTYLDGVPQLHGYSANIELIDVTHIEFVRGAQGMLYGRNTVGGVIHVLSRSPNLSAWEGNLEGGYGSYDLREGRLRLSGPLVRDKLGLSLAVGYASRDGFSENDVTGNDVDSREAVFGKLQLQWVPTDVWSAHFILSAERDRDGDYALADLAALRESPHHVQRDFEGYSDRDIVAPTLALEYQGDRVNFISTSGLVQWETNTMTDLDYSPLPAVVREAKLRDFQLSQELRWASAADSPLALTDDLKLAWKVGMLFFTQRYCETSVNNIALPYPVNQTSPSARLEDTGLGAYAQATLTAWDVWALSLGLRDDYEHKEADLQTFFTPAIAPPTALETDRDFTQVSPQFSLTRRIAPDKMVYGTVGRGYRAGGFNPVSPAGSEAYDEETSWNYEIGVKTTWLEERLMVNLAAFHISWESLQLNLPTGQNYYIANAGDADSTGVELELTARPLNGWDIFGSVGYERARFRDGTTSIQTDKFGTNTTVDVGGNALIFTPEFTANAGTQYSWELGPETRVFVRAEIAGYGRYFYNAANTGSQGAYWLTNLRAGVHISHWFAEAWVKNAFNTEYVPVAFEYPNGQSGFLGESGTPLTAGLRAGFNF
jgi:iron complex outermembrane recepter protein